MAQRDQIRRALGSHNARQLGDRQNIALFASAGADQFKGTAVDQHTPRRDSGALGLRLFSYIDHPRAAGRIKVCKILHITLQFGSWGDRPR